MHLKGRGLVTASLVAIVPTMAPAYASPQSSQATSCEAYAAAHNIDSWVCWGGLLTYTENGQADGQAARTPITIRVAEDAVVQETGAEPTNYDTYCEYTSICTGYSHDYISWTKGNASYGNSNGGIGSFDVVLRTSLNGRQPQWRTMWYHDSGPALGMQNMFINCREDNTGPDSNCGVFGADNGDGTFYVGTGHYSSPTIYGNRLNDSNDYYATVSGYFHPAGYGTFAMSALRSAQFNCYGGSTAPCYFP